MGQVLCHCDLHNPSMRGKSHKHRNFEKYSHATPIYISSKSQINHLRLSKPYCKTQNINLKPRYWKPWWIIGMLKEKGRDGICCLCPQKQTMKRPPRMWLKTAVWQDGYRQNRGRQLNTTYPLFCDIKSLVSSIMPRTKNLKSQNNILWKKSQNNNSKHTYS